MASRRKSVDELQLKPVGNSCNFSCRYCYENPFKCTRLVRMSPEILERVLASYLSRGKNKCLTWHGGEPLLAGLDFYQSAMELIAKHRRPGQRIEMILQTNASLATLEMARFFRENKVDVGVSLDGPEHIHGRHRVFTNGQNTFPAVMRGLSILREGGLDPSVIATVTRESLPDAVQVFEFLVENGFSSIRYSPVFDSVSDAFSISSDEWFEYLVAVFHRWVEMANPEISIREFDDLIAWLDGPTAQVCDGNCQRWVSVDPDGSLYPCEYLRAETAYGNIMDLPEIHSLLKTGIYKKFAAVINTPPPECRICEFYSRCGNGCPATRVRNGQLDHSGVFVYCDQRRKLFELIKGVFGRGTL